MLIQHFCKLLKRNSTNSLQSRYLSGAADTLLDNLTNYEAIGLPQKPQTSASHNFDLGRMRRLLDAMHNPQEKIKAVQIAGTKGKGSVASFLSSILQQSRYKVGLYTSPHVRDLRERIAINAKSISQVDLDEIAGQWTSEIHRVQKAKEGMLSHFEVLTALALRHFANSQVDIAVIETGVGGTLDATNIFSPQNQELAVITALGLEHKELLGDTIEEIAEAKAGICKPGKYCVIGPQPDEKTLAAVWKAVTAAGALPIQEMDSEDGHSLKITPGKVSVSDGQVSQKFSIFASPESHDVDSHLIGAHQASNAHTAILAALALKRSNTAWKQISMEGILKGISEAKLPGRFQVQKTSSGTWIVLDGAHTPPSANTVAKTIHQAFPEKPIALIIAMANDKDHSGVMVALRKIRPKLVIFTSVPIAGDSTRSAPPGMLTGFWQEANFEDDKPFRCRELIQANMASAVQISEREMASWGEEGVICVTGSLHAVAAALKHIQDSS